MSEKFPTQPQENNPEETEKPEKNEGLENLKAVFDQAEAAFAAEGRDKAMPFLPKIYNELIALNKRSKEEWGSLWDWNPDGDLTEEEFNAMNLRRKLLSNATGIMTASGKIRHDLNKI